MTLLAMLFFSGVLAAALWAIVVTIRPRFDYIVALLTDAVTAPVLVPVAQRRQVRRLNPGALRSQLSSIRAAA